MRGTLIKMKNIDWLILSSVLHRIGCLSENVTAVKMRNK